MIIKIFSVYDLKAESFLQPMFFRSSNEAIRAFSKAVNDEGHEFFKHAEDYVLFEIGNFDDVSGLLHQRDPLRLMSAYEASTFHKEHYAVKVAESVA